MSSVLTVTSAETLMFEGGVLRCAIGKSGFAKPEDKSEGDNKTPMGIYQMRECWYRPDKIDAPNTQLPLRQISSQDGWCDAPSDAHYNQHVTLPYDASCETLWRDDDAYDLIIPISYNDDPVVKGKGSAIFLHVAQPDFRGTEGCVVLSLEDWLMILPHLDTDSSIAIAPNAL